MMPRPALLACFLVALGLRAGVALVTEHKPIFPSYYYTDAELMEQSALEMVRSWRSNESSVPSLSPSQRAHAFLLAVFYRVFGHHPLGAKLLSALIGALLPLAFYRLAKPLFGQGVALACAGLLAVWPTLVFFTSQIFKDGLVMLLAFLSLGGFLPAMAGKPPGRWILTAAAALVLLGFMRAYIMASLALVLAAGLLAAIASARRAGRSTRTEVLALLVLAAAPLVYRPLSRAVFGGPLRSSSASASDPTVQSSVLPKTYDPSSQRYIRPFSPRAISDTRRIRQTSDQEWALKQKGRSVGTQLFFGLEFRTWWDVLAFLPKGMFYVLFMPLPGLYPLGSNLGRWLASIENVGLLALALAAAVGFFRLPKTTGRSTLVAFFLFMAVGSALLEFDLGSATRHRLLYMPMLFPFALSMAVPSRQTRKGKLKVFQVLECGGAGGTGNQVAALCNGLDPALFDTALVYAVRPGQDAAAYRASAPGAKAAFHVPEMVREISPLSDLKAFWKLYRLFRSEAPDVVHAHSSKAGFLARLAARAAGVPRIFYTPHGYGFLQQDRNALARGLYRAVEWALSGIGTIVAVSPSEAELARGLAPSRPVEVVCDPYLGAVQAETAPSPHEGTVIGGCGRLTYARHPDAFVNLCQRLTDSRNNLRCVWVGGGEDEPAVRRHLENMNLLAKVEVTGWLEAPQARERLRGLDVFVHYSRWDGLPNAVLEAMAMGLPVVASDVPGCRDAVVHGETGFLAKSEIELLEYAHRLVDDKELRRRFGEAGRKRVLKEFSLPAALAKLSELYSQA